MGRGNTCVRGKYEGLYYIDNDYFEYHMTDEDGNDILDKQGYPERDYDMERMLWEDDLDLIKEYFCKRFKSFYPSDTSYDRDAQTILENRLFYIAIEDNEWSMAIELREKESEYYRENLEGLQAKHYQNYLEGMKEVLFNLYPTIGIYGGAWTSGTIDRPDNFKFIKV